MSGERKTFVPGIDFPSILTLLSKQIYETPLAFIRENVQNAVDAVRIQAFREGADPADARYRIDITVEGDTIKVRDNGTGMSAEDLQRFFWSMGASGKRTAEAIAAGCVGMFGIGGFANFGVCHTLEVISQIEGSPEGTLTRLSQADIEASQGRIPPVTLEASDHAGPRGTLVVGHLRNAPNLDELRRYLRDFVKFVPSAVFFGTEKLSQHSFSDIEDRTNLTQIGGPEAQDWQGRNLVVTGRLYEDRGHTLVAAIDGLAVSGEAINMTGHIRFENGAFDVFKRGFKLCATTIATNIGVSGRLDCDKFIPTAGRDSLDAETTSLLNRITQTLEAVAVDEILSDPERIGQYTRLFRYINQHGLVDKLGNVKIRLADGSESTLGAIRRRAENGGVSVFFGVAQKQALNQIMQARGHLVVLLSADRHRQQAERHYLEKFCRAKPFDGMIDCRETYTDLTRFEKVVLSELELNISKAYEVKHFRLVPGKLTEDIPVFVKEYSGNQPPDIFVDVRHDEIAKLEALGYTQILYSLIATFCREYLGPSLKKWSPRFFGDGALNLELLAKRRSELWVLLKDDIGIVRKPVQRQVVRRSDVQVVNVGSGHAQAEPQAGKPMPRLLRIIDEEATTKLAGYYIRLPDSAFHAYGDLLPECESRGVVWAGNKILYVASDTVSAAFQYEIRLDEVVATDVNGVVRGEGAEALEQPLQQMYGGLYFPIPATLERFLVPRGDEEIRLELHCDWIDMRTAKHWHPRESAT